MSEKEVQEKKAEGPKPLPPLFTFANAGVSGMAATCVVHPMDVIKNQIQVQREKTSVAAVIKRVYQDEGIFKFYSGLTAGLLRQITYTTTRLGVYNTLQDEWKRRYTGKPNFCVLSLMAGTAGALGAFVGTPAEVALVRMTSDARLPPGQRRNYKGVFNAFTRISKEEGVTTLWRGSVPTMGRAIVVNISQLATYSQAKYLISKKFHLSEGIGLHFCASMMSGFLAAFNSMPLDVAKTRIQNLKTTVGKPPGLIPMMILIGKNEGIPALWKGFVPTYCRIGPHTVLTFIINEQITRTYRLYT